MEQQEHLTKHPALSAWLAGNKSRRFEYELDGNAPAVVKLIQKAKAAPASFTMTAKKQQGETLAECVTRAVRTWNKEVVEGLGY